MISKSLTVVVMAACTLFAGVAAAQTVNGFANGGFEDTTPQSPLPPGYTSPANHWVAPPTAGIVRISGDAHSGAHSVELRSYLPTGPATLLQNSIAEGGLPALTTGDTPVLNFWAKGVIGLLAPGEFNFTLRYQGADGSIVYDSGPLDLRCRINFCQELPGPTPDWKQYAFTGGVVPAGATSASVEFTLAESLYTGGPPGNPDFDRGNRIFLDDVFLAVTAVPESESYALMLLGLGLVGGAVRRRQAGC